MNGASDFSLDNRLALCAYFVRDGAKVADIGTDHAYLPVWLCRIGRCDTAIAADINPLPLERGIETINNSGLNNRIEARLSNGLEKIGTGDEADTVIIAGMGAELIVDILSNCDFVNELHLILQPMTHPEIARKYLYDNGFEINNDFIVTDAKHSYSIFDANYTGKTTPKVPKDYFLGNITDFSQKEYFLHQLNYLKNKSNHL